MKSKRLTIVVLIFVCLLAVYPSAFAIENRASDRIASYTGSLSKDSAGVLTVNFTTWANNTMDQVGSNKIAIQWQVGSRWITEYTFTPENTPPLLGSNSAFHSGIVSYVPYHPNSKYRAVIDYYAKDSFGESTIQRETNEV